MLNVYEAFIKVQCGTVCVYMYIAQAVRQVRNLLLIKNVKCFSFLPAAPEELPVVSRTFSQLQRSAESRDCTRAAPTSHEQV